MDIIEKYKTHPEEIYTKTFFRLRTRRRTTRWQATVGKYIAKKYKLTSLVDFGCALGGYLIGAQKAGITNLKGFEYQYDIAKEYMSEKIIDKIQYGNVMEKIDCGKFDCAMSVEVAEHILPEKSDVFVDNLVRASKKYIFITAATPGQGGKAHINEQIREYWIEKFQERGFKYSKKHRNINNAAFTKLKNERKIIMPVYMFKHMFFIKE